MQKTKRIGFVMPKRYGSLKLELLKKSREAALAAVQIFNNPNITFKSESYIVLMNIAWTYLLHAYYREKKVEYRYFTQKPKSRSFHRTKHGAYKHWELERCLNDKNCPIDKNAANNLRFLIGLRHEIEHQMTSKIDDLLSARFQACCLNYNEYIIKLFDEDFGIQEHLSFSLQFSTISQEQKDMLDDHPDLPANIKGFIRQFDETLSDEEFSNPHYAYRILFVPKTANRKGQADKVIEFVPDGSPLAQGLNKEYAVIKETEKKKYLPKQIVEAIKGIGFEKFSMHYHTQLWRALDAKKPSKNYGTHVANGQWYWYENWLQVVKDYCQKNSDKFK